MWFLFGVAVFVVTLESSVLLSQKTKGGNSAQLTLHALTWHAGRTEQKISTTHVLYSVLNGSKLECLVDFIHNVLLAWKVSQLSYAMKIFVFPFLLVQLQSSVINSIPLIDLWSTDMFETLFCFTHFRGGKKCYMQVVLKNERLVTASYKSTMKHFYRAISPQKRASKCFRWKCSKPTVCLITKLNCVCTH